MNIKTVSQPQYGVSLLYSYLPFFLLGALFFSVCYLRFSPWISSVFYGDDLWFLVEFYKGSCGTRAADIMTVACYEKFRPVPSALILSLFNLFGSKVDHYFHFNITLIVSGGLLSFAIVRRLSQAHIVLPIFVGLAVISSRFAVYSATQIIGPVESLTFLLCLTMVYAIVRASESTIATEPWSWVGIGFGFLAVFSHERYIVISVWLCLAFVMLPTIRILPKRSVIRLCFASLMIPISYIGYKVLVLGSAFLVGTGGHHLGFDINLVVELLAQATFSIFGFNYGPPHLVGINTTSLSFFPGWLLAIALIFLWVILLAVGVLNQLQGTVSTMEKFNRFVWPLLILMLGGALILPAVMTIRLDQRWLYLSFVLIVLILPLTFGIRSELQAKFSSVLFLLLSMISMSLDTVIMKYYGNLYFSYSSDFATKVKQEIVDNKLVGKSPLVFFTNPVHCSWSLFNGEFFKVYEGKSRHIRCLTSVDDVYKTSFSNDTRFIKVDRDKLTDVTDILKRSTSIQPSEVPFNFFANFSIGKIDYTDKVSTPNGQGVFQLPVIGEVGARNSIVVVSGFSYKFDGIEIQDDVHLSFDVSMVYPSQDSARAIVSIARAGASAEVIYQDDLTPPEDGLKFQRVSIDLSNYAGEVVSIVFAARTPGPNSAGHWIAYASAALVKD